MEDNQNISLNYKVSGDIKTPALVFLHFFGGSLHSWDALINILQKDFYCIALDLPGFGASPAGDVFFKGNDSARQVISLLETLNINSYIMVGHSMGGKIALCLATRRLAGLKQVILVAPSPPTPEPGSDKSRKELLSTFSNPEEIKKLINKLTYKPLPERVFEEISNEHMQASKTGWDGWIKLGSQEDISSLMKEVEVPVNVICSPDDPNFPPSLLAPIFKKYLPVAKIIEIKKSGHLIPVEITSELAALIIKIIN